MVCYCIFFVMELGVSVEDVLVLFMGGYGDMMVFMLMCIMVGGIFICCFLDEEKLVSIVE